MALGIPSYSGIKPFKWSEHEISLLGTMSDEKVARMIGVSKGPVMRKRQSLGIESFASQSNLWRVWTADELALLAKHSDVEVARILEVQPGTVSAKRHSYGIEPHRKKLRKKKSKLDTLVWNLQNLALLGQLSDSQLGKMIGVNRKSVLRKRKKLGIKSIGQTQLFHPWTKEEIALLGTLGDRAIAEQIGINQQSVAIKRVRLGISSFQANSRAKRSHQEYR
jgi:hypothetical protein